MAAQTPSSLSQAFRPAREAVLLWVALTACAVLGVWLGGRYGERKLSEAIRNDAINAARAAMLGIDPALHDRIAHQEKMWSDLHKKALTILLNFHRQYPDVSRVRTFMLSGDEVVVILDTETVAGDVGMRRPVNPTMLRTPLDKTDPAYATVRSVLTNRESAAMDESNYDGYRHWRPGVVPLGNNAAIEADLTSVEQENNLANLRMWIGTGIGLAVIACGVVALIYFNIRSALLVSESTGGEARRGQEWLQHRNSRLVEALGRIVLHRDLRTGVLLWDGNARALLGYDIEEMPTTFRDWSELVHPDDTAPFQRAIEERTPEQRTFEIEYRVRNAAGVWRWFRERGVVSFVTEENGDIEPSTLDSVLDDISDLKKKAEEVAALALIASRTDNGVCLTDVHGHIQWINPTFERLTGFDFAEAQGRTLADLFPPSPGQQTITRLFQEAALGKGGRTELQLSNRSGAAYWTSLELQPLKDDAGTINRVVAIQSDITANKEFEARLVTAKEAAETADRAKSEFLAVMSHEIRTPLNAVLGFTRLLLDTPLDPQQRDYIDTIRSSGDSLLHLLNDILDFSKMDASSMHLERAPFDLRGCVTDALDVLIAPATTRGVDLYADIPAGIPELIIGDRARLRQVLLNLAGNAVKFTEEGEIVIAVTPRPASSPHVARLRFEVRDTGPGIAPDQQTQLFKPFTQADSSATRKHGGTGLGLAISKRIIELMGGTIGLTSQLGQGSTFWFELELGIAPNQPAPNSLLRGLNGLRVLLVEKNPGLREVMIRQLSEWGMQVEAFGRGRDAIFAAEHRRFDVALLDATPPDIDGLGLVDRLRHSPRRNVGGIILTGAPGKLPAINAAPFDSIHRLVKPVHTNTLADTILRAAPRLTRAAQPRTPMAPPTRYPRPGLASRETTPRQPAANQAANAAPRRPTGRRVLVADDNAINRKLVKKILDGLGCESELVTNGRECVAAIQAGHFDAILMDIQMPEMDGLTATRAIRELGITTPIIALTADAMPDDRTRCLNAGMNDYLQKPVRADALGSALDRSAHAVATA